MVKMANLSKPDKSEKRKLAEKASSAAIGSAKAAAREGRKRNNKDNDGPKIVFDEAGRSKHLTGFRKRRKERKRRGQKEILTQARKDTIQLHKERRQEIKQQWKEIQWAERKVEKLLALKYPDQAHLILKREAQADVTHAWMPKSLEDGTEDSVVGGGVKVSFVGEEEDDEFGDCEVTTTAMTSVLAKLPVRDPRKENYGTLAHMPAKIAGPKGSQLTLNWRGFYETDIQRSERRQLAVRKEEKAHFKAMEKKVTSALQEKKRQRKKPVDKLKKKGKKRVKVGAKARRKRAKKN